VSRFAHAVGVEPRFTRLSPLMLRIAGLFIPEAAQIPEMIYQWRTPYVLDDSRYRARFHVHPTELAAAVNATLTWARACYGRNTRAAA
jgi:hypothetical protein